MGTTPRIGRFSSTHQPDRTDRTQPATHLSPDDRERQEVAENLDRERAEALVEPEIHLDLSPDELAAELAEKERLAEELRETRPAKLGPERSAPETLSSRPISDVGGKAPERIPEVVVELVDPQVVRSLESAESELLALEQDESASLDAELRQYERVSALEMARLKAAGDAKRAEIRKRQEAARAEIEKARAAALPVEIKQRAKTIQQTAEDNRLRTAQPLEQQRSAIAAEWAPMLQTAKQTVAEIAQLRKSFGPSLREMGDVAAFADTDSRWPLELRMKLRDRCILPARKLTEFIDNYVRDDYTRETPLVIIRQVEKMLLEWTPWTMVATLRQQLGYINLDAVRYVRNTLSEISRQFEAIEEQGKAYIASGAVPEPLRQSDVTEALRQGMKSDLIMKGARDPRQNYASGMGELVPNPKDQT